MSYQMDHRPSRTFKETETTASWQQNRQPKIISFLYKLIKLRVRTQNIIFLFLNQNILGCEYSKEPSQWEIFTFCQNALAKENKTKQTVGHGLITGCEQGLIEKYWRNKHLI